MSCDGYTAVWDLAPEELVGLDDARGTTLRVTRGTLWVTLQNDTRDVVLNAGDTFVVDRGGLTVAQAHGRTTVCVLARDLAARRLRRGREPWPARLARRLAAIAATGLARGWAPYV